MSLRHRSCAYTLLLILGSGIVSGCGAAVRAEVSPITQGQCANLSASHVMSDNAPVKCDRLRSVAFPYIDFDGQTHEGEVVVLDVLAPRVQMIFTALYQKKFPLHQALTMEHYQGDDEASMADNNTSAFNARPMTGASAWSMHAYGAAIDLNPRQNPYIAFGADGAATVLPPLAAKEAVNRLNYRPNKNFRPGMAEEVIDIFASNGFLQWGGYWNFPIDYQHFEIGSSAYTQQLASASVTEAQRLFEQVITDYASCMAEPGSLSHEAARAACVSRVAR
ncbi:M15 family metallopeptidase [Paraburkholderia bonniea]|uniref:M15 family metallopeptidase n=1 Tax=Paraburkholderia bonniea TaxID=2152891 RepID=UPI002572DC4C|nr:M15 family metallopeptidase [Paraburkholderia bonniea]WJF89064.1 M15 family metallopeptidase [Paraburkholderia bonniea]WJF92380.1 M15 family metallopeptidase [Paraburkholderia bonniea]